MSRWIDIGDGSDVCGGPVQCVWLGIVQCVCSGSIRRDVGDDELVV